MGRLVGIITKRHILQVLPSSVFKIPSMALIRSSCSASTAVTPGRNHFPNNSLFCCVLFRCVLFLESNAAAVICAQVVYEAVPRSLCNNMQASPSAARLSTMHARVQQTAPLGLHDRVLAAAQQHRPLGPGGGNKNKSLIRASVQGLCAMRHACERSPKFCMQRISAAFKALSLFSSASNHFTTVGWSLTFTRRFPNAGEGMLLEQDLP
jgi:hypothetical protein